MWRWVWKSTKLAWWLYSRIISWCIVRIRGLRCLRAHWVHILYIYIYKARFRFLVVVETCCRGRGTPVDENWCFPRLVCGGGGDGGGMVVVVVVVVVVMAVVVVAAAAVVVRRGKSIKTEKKRKRATPSGKTGIRIVRERRSAGGRVDRVV